MKKLIGCIAFLLLVCGEMVQAQASQSFKVKDGEAVADAIPATALYRYPTFQEGQVVYMNGKFSAATFNFNYLLGEVQFINTKGDTLTIAGEPTLVSVLIGESTFIYNTNVGYAEVVEASNTLKLGKRQKLEMAGTQKAGAYNQSTRTSSIENKNTYLGSNGQRFSLAAKGDVLFSEKVLYFLIDQNNTFYKANKANVLTLFPSHKKAINGYLKAHAIDLNEEEDLKKLLQFCSTL